MRVVVDEPGKSWVVESCDGGVGPGRQGEQGKGWRIGKEWRETGNSVETEKGRLRRWVARTGSCAWGQGGVVDMAGVHCSLFVVVRVSLFVALIFFRSAPSPLRLHRRSSLLTFSLLGLPSSFRFFRLLCPLLCFSISLPSFLPLFNCFPHSRSSPALSVRLSFRFLLAPLSALAGSHFWFLSFPVSSPSLSPSVFISSVLAQSSCLSFFLSLYLALSVLRFHTPPPFGRDGR